MPKKEKNTVEPKDAVKKKKRRKLDIWNKLAICILTCFLVGCISVFFVLVNIINDPDGMRFSEDGLTTLSNSRIYDTNGNLVYEFGEEIREDITYDQLPQTVIDAFLSIEDSRFFDHNGFDLPRFISAAINNLQSGDFSQGGSTITMQMIDNAFTKNQEEKLIAQDGSISKIGQVKLKIQEIYLALIAEQSIGKEEIFEYYVNRIWFGSGNNTRGIQKASKYFFNKDVSQLNLSEAAFLAGSINSPSTYNPLANMYDAEIDHLQAATERRNQTLELMYNHGYISQEEYDLAANTDLSYALNYVQETSTDPNEAYIDQVIDEVIELTGQDPGIIPMDIYTALNTDVQNQCDQICAGNIIAFPEDAYDIGFAVLDNDTGEIIAVGPGRRYHTDAVKIDNSTDRKQPGSSMKPLLAYCSTFDLLGWSTEHTVNDKAADYFHTGTNLNNSDGSYAGNISLAYALGVSKNCPAAAAMVELVEQTGYDYWIEFCRKLGYDEDVCEEFVEQYAIGGASMYASPIQQASAYTIFANKGNRVESHTVRKVIRRSDNQETEGNTETYSLISEQAAFMMSFLLYKVVYGNYGNMNEALQSWYPSYGKSGTSDWGTDGLQYGIPAYTYKDEWSLGYTSDFTVAVWSGFTAQYQQQGYYFSFSELLQGQAFEITHYLLDYCATYGNYTDIAVPDGVSSYGSGYIKTEFAAQGDTSSSSDTESTETDEQTACESAGGSWDDESSSCTYPEQEEEESYEEETQPEQPQEDQSGETEAASDGQIAAVVYWDPTKLILGLTKLLNSL